MRHPPEKSDIAGRARVRPGPDPRPSAPPIPNRCRPELPRTPAAFAALIRECSAPGDRSERPLGRGRRGCWLKGDCELRFGAEVGSDMQHLEYEPELLPVDPRPRVPDASPVM